MGVTAIVVVAGSIAVLSAVHTAPDGDAASAPSAAPSPSGSALTMARARAIADANMAAVAVPSTASSLAASPSRWLDAPSTGLADCDASSTRIATATPRFWSDAHLSLSEAVDFYEAHVPAGLATYAPGGGDNGDGTSHATVAYRTSTGARDPELVLVYILKTAKGLDIRVDSMVNAQGLCPTP